MIERDDMLFDLGGDVADGLVPRSQPSPSQLMAVPTPPPPPMHVADLLDPIIHTLSNQLHGYRDLSKRGLLLGSLESGHNRTVDMVLKLMKTMSQLELAEMEREAMMSPEELRARLLGLLDGDPGLRSDVQAGPGHPHSKKQQGARRRRKSVGEVVEGTE